ncbi:MAG: FAD-binding protein, partial [Thermoguttaceae bacterium]|nr:FAD-binding protein [Thermoguttaceae bacterium]
MKEKRADVLVLGSGAAGLAAAVRLRAEGMSDIAVVTEGLHCGTSINTGSDKQTYYKQGLYGEESDSPGQMAQSYTQAGSTHGDLALTESAVSTRAFFHLVNLGVPFPQDEAGQYIGYKTDHDPRRRATSCGPYTSREMCLALIREAKSRNIAFYENRVVVKLVAVEIDPGLKESERTKQIVGLLAIDTTTGELEAWRCNRLVFASGGPGGLYRSSVYPAVHTGAIGLALEAGARARNLPESQFGLASFTDVSGRTIASADSNGETTPAPVNVFRWNVSGTFMQVLPRFISTDSDGHGEVEFLRGWFETVGQMNSNVFLKGYQWPFDVRKALGGSSLIDLIVYYETVVCGRRVFLEFRSNPDGMKFDELAPEAYEYLQKSEALFGTPLERLRHMNPGAVQLYLDHGIDLSREPLEIAVCSQHNNGGLAGDTWYQSENIAGLFPIGEVNGSHGVARPGGSALNAGQVGAFRAAQYIAHMPTPGADASSAFEETACAALRRQYKLMLAGIRKLNAMPGDWRTTRNEFQGRMSRYGSHFRSLGDLRKAVQEAWNQFDSLRLNVSDDTAATENENAESCAKATVETVESLRNLQLCLAHAVYL